MTVELPAYRRKQIDIFYPDEIQRLAQMIMDEPTTTGIGILLTLNTGLRLGELCALQYKDIDLRNGVVHVRKTVQRIRSGDRTSLMVLPPKVTAPGVLSRCRGTWPPFCKSWSSPIPTAKTIS